MEFSELVKRLKEIEEREGSVVESSPTTEACNYKNPAMEGHTYHCKDCGCEMHNCDPGCDCPHDSHDETGDWWVDENGNGVPDVFESTDNQGFSDKDIKMAYGIINDPRYKGGNMTAVVNKIEQIAKGLSKHPGVQKAIQATNEDVVKESTKEETYVHNMFMKMLTMCDMMEKGVRRDGLLIQRINQVGGDDSYMDDVRTRINALYSAIEDAHMGAMAHIHEDDETIVTREGKYKVGYKKKYKK